MNDLPVSGFVVGVTGAVVVAGPDAADFLQGLISQDVGLATSDSAVRSFLLGPRGKFRALLWVVRDGDGFWLFTDTPENVEADLRRFHLRVDCTIESFAGPVVDVIGPRPPQVSAAVLARVPWRGPERWILAGSEPGELDLPQLEDGAWTRIRIEAGEPAMNVDVDEKTIPQESGLVGEAVSFAKGCYLGQELVARIDSRGHVNRRMVRLEIDAPSPPAAPAQVEFDGQPVGTVTSAAGGDGTVVALAILPTSVSGDVAVSWGDQRATGSVTEL